jgi:GNAT superfamily N-acetyltransferase
VRNLGEEKKIHEGSEMSVVHFAACDPEESPAADLLAEMARELNELYGTSRRLDRPSVEPAELRPPGGIYLVGWEGEIALAGGGLRPLGDGVAEIKRMFVRPPARSRGIAGQLLRALEAAAHSLGYRRVRLDTGPKQVHAHSLYTTEGYVPIADYSGNPFATFWGEKDLDPA